MSKKKTSKISRKKSVNKQVIQNNLEVLNNMTKAFNSIVDKREEQDNQIIENKSVEEIINECNEVINKDIKTIEKNDVIIDI